jgi:hypothetical protein
LSPAQKVKPISQTQSPPEQNIKGGHTLPHVPQLSASVDRSRHPLSQHSSPEAQHTPSQQSWSQHTPSQQSWSIEQHTPPVQQYSSPSQQTPCKPFGQQVPGEKQHASAPHGLPPAASPAATAWGLQPHAGPAVARWPGAGAGCGRSAGPVHNQASPSNPETATATPVRRRSGSCITLCCDPPRPRGATMNALAASGVAHPQTLMELCSPAWRYNEAWHRQ